MALWGHKGSRSLLVEGNKKKGIREEKKCVLYIERDTSGYMRKWKRTSLPGREDQKRRR